MAGIRGNLGKSFDVLKLVIKLEDNASPSSKLGADLRKMINNKVPAVDIIKELNLLPIEKLNWEFGETLTAQIKDHA